MITAPQGKLGVCAGKQGGHSLRGEAGPFSDDDSERTAVIARCGMERSAACRSGAKGNNVRSLHLCQGEQSL
jgi:hypothetical protein